MYNIVGRRLAEASVPRAMTTGSFFRGRSQPSTKKAPILSSRRKVSVTANDHDGEAKEGKKSGKPSLEEVRRKRSLYYSSSRDRAKTARASATKSKKPKSVSKSRKSSSTVRPSRTSNGPSTRSKASGIKQKETERPEAGAANGTAECVYGRSPSHPAPGEQSVGVSKKSKKPSHSASSSR